MLTRGSQSFVVALLMAAVILAGCAKRPATTQASAPAPSPSAPAVQRPSTPPASTPSAPSVSPQPSAPAAPSVPAPTARPSPKEFVAVSDLNDIHFDFDKYDIRPGDAKVLDTNAQWMKANPGHLILIEGHCDERGTNEYNLALGERRAKSTMNYLVSQGVQASRITIISYGEERPVCGDKNEACWGKNRRAHFLAKPR